MVREPDATMQPTLQDNQLMSKHRVLSLKPQLRPEWRGQDGQSETEQPDHSASLCDSIASSTQIRFSVHTASIASDTMGCSPTATDPETLRTRASCSPCRRAQNNPRRPKLRSNNPANCPVHARAAAAA